MFPATTLSNPTTTTLMAINPRLPIPKKRLNLQKQQQQKQQQQQQTVVVCKSSLSSEMIEERGVQFQVGDTFFRHESAIARDLGVLAATLQKKSNGGGLRVLDAMCGCGIRSLRYLVHSQADFVLANDANADHAPVLLANLSKAVAGGAGGGGYAVSNTDVNRLMAQCYLERDYFDFVDVDSFGSDSTFLRSALTALKFGGLLYVTSTDGYTSGGHRPHHSLASYGAFVSPMPYCNELGLRMLIGGAVREASVLGYHVIPLFSYYSYHGPVFRVLLRLNRGKLPNNRHYSFVSYCKECGNSQAIMWDKLGQINCPCNANDPDSLVVSGPLWTGPLHSGTYLTEMLNLAEQWGWIGIGRGTDLKKLLSQMIDESDPRLPFGYIKLDEVSSRGKINTPPITSLMSFIHKAGYAASRSHIASNAIKTNCPMSMCIMIAKELQAC